MRKLLCCLIVLLMTCSVVAAQNSMTQQYLLSQGTAEKVQLQQVRSELKSDQAWQRQRGKTLEGEPLSQSELSRALISRENAKAALGGVQIALADVKQSIQLLEATIDTIRAQLQRSEIQAEQQLVAQLKTKLEAQESVLQLQRKRQATLLALQKVRQKLFDLQNQWHQRLQQVYQHQLRERNVLALKAKITRLYTAQQQLLQQVERYKSATPASAMKPSAVYDFTLHALNEKITLNRLGLFLMQLNIRAEAALSATRLGGLGKSTGVSDLKTLLVDLKNMTGVVELRVDYSQKYREMLAQAYSNKEITHSQYAQFDQQLQGMKRQYQEYFQQLMAIQKKLAQTLERARQQFKYGLYSRDTLPGWHWGAWGDLGKRVLEVPVAATKYIGGTTQQITVGLRAMSSWMLEGFFVFVLLVIVFGYFLNRYLKKLERYLAIKARRFSENLLWVILRLIRKNLGFLLAIFFLSILEVETDADLSLVLDLLLLLVATHILINIARLVLVTKITDVVAQDDLLFNRLRWFFILSAVVAALMLVVHQLPVAENLRSIVNRVFMLVLLMLSLFLFLGWKVLPQLLRQVFSVRRNYISNAIKIFCRVLPFTLFSNAVIGLVGFVKLALLIGVYQGIALCVLLGYLIVRGLLFDAMELCYEGMIRYVHNGWLWVQVLLKPLDTIIRLALFVLALWMLIVAYNLDESPRFIAVLKTLYYEPIVMLGGNSINLSFLLRMTIFLAILFWVGKWSREFAFRVVYVRARDIGVRNSLSVFTQYVIVIIGIFSGLRFLGVDLRGLAVVAAAFAAGIGFGLRDLVSNFFSGILLLVERPFRAGDSIALGQYEGEVVSTGMRSMKIRTWDHMDVIVPNSDMFTKPFVNWTHQDSIVRTVLKLKIDRVDDPYQVQQLVYGVLKELPAVVDDPQPEVFMKEISETLVELEVRYFINLQVEKSRPRVRSEVLFAIWDCFKRNGVRPPYPHYEINVNRKA